MEGIPVLSVCTQPGWPASMGSDPRRPHRCPWKSRQARSRAEKARHPSRRGPRVTSPLSILPWRHSCSMASTTMWENERTGALPSSGGCWYRPGSGLAIAGVVLWPLSGAHCSSHGSLFPLRGEATCDLLQGQFTLVGDKAGSTLIEESASDFFCYASGHATAK